MTTKRSNGNGGVYYIQSRRRWTYHYTDTDGRRKTRVAVPNSERGAETCLARALAARGQGETIAKAMTVSEWCDAWLETRRIAGVRPRSLDTYRQRMRKHVLPKLGRLKIDNVTPAHLETLYARLLSSGLAPRTIADVHRTIGSMLNVAKRRRLVGHVVTQLVEPPRAPRYEARTLTLDEVKRLLASLKGHRHEAMWTFILGTGCRYGEAAGLTWDNVDLDTATARIWQQASRLRDPVGKEHMAITPVKTDAGRRELALPPFVVAALRRQTAIIAAMREKAGPRWDNTHDGICFPSHLGRILTASPVLKAWHEHLRSVGLEGGHGQSNLRIHDLRHTKGTLMSDAGEDTTIIQRTLGHARQSITADLYVGHVPAALRASAQRYEEMLDPSK